MGEKKNKHKDKHLSVKLKSVLIVAALDVLFAFGAYWAARAIMFYRYAIPPGYEDFEWVAMTVMIMVTIAMLVFFDCYNSVWKYAGRVEFFKFVFAYFASFGIIVIFKLIMAAAFEFDLLVPHVLMYLLFSAICSGVTRFINGIVNYVVYVRRLVGAKDKPGAETKRTVVIGAGYVGSLIINRFINNPQDGYFPVAFIDDDPDKQGKKIYGIKVEGGMDRLAEVIAKYRAQTIVIAIMTLGKPQLRSIFSK